MQVVNSLLFHLIDSSVEFSQYTAVYEGTCLTFYLFFWLYLLLKARNFDIYLSISQRAYLAKCLQIDIIQYVLKRTVDLATVKILKGYLIQLPLGGKKKKGELQLKE